MRKSKWIAVAVTGAFAALLLAIPALGSSARDANNDRLPDRWEVRHDLPLSVNQAPKDQDQDGLKNMGEYKNHTNPRDPDSDANGTEDGPQCQGHDGQGGPHHGPPPAGDDDSGTPPAPPVPPVAP